MSGSQIKDIIAKVDKERKITNKASFDTLSSKLPDRLIGRQNEIEQLVRYLWDYKDNRVVPLVSIYGRSGTGKSTVVRYVCNNISDIKMCFANLRKAKTVFGGANLILSALDKPSLKSAQGLNVALEKIQESILESMGSKKLFVLVLDEFDVIFYDKRGNPSDFVYKLIEMQSELIEKGCLCMIVTISNNILADYGLDDRVRSRIGNSEIFFKPYSQKEMLNILGQRAKEAFEEKIDDKVLERCANLSYLEHGDARRAVDLLRVAAETAIKEKKPISVNHVNTASLLLQKDRVSEMLKTLSHHSRVACMAIATTTYLLDKELHKTSLLYEQYKKYTNEPVSYRRFSELLIDLENTGFLNSKTTSKGQKGYNSEFTLLVQPELVGTIIDEAWWNKNAVEKKKKLNSMPSLPSVPRSSPYYNLYKMVLKQSKPL